MTERLCNDCTGVLAQAPFTDGECDLDLICVVCGAALTLGGLLLGELDARDEDAA